MGDVVNLRRVRKNKGREQAEKDAAANRMKHGRPKASRVEAAAEKARPNRVADLHKIEKE